jgi:hypothetical protein
VWQQLWLLGAVGGGGGLGDWRAQLLGEASAGKEKGIMIESRRQRWRPSQNNGVAMTVVAGGGVTLALGQSVTPWHAR